MKKISLIILFCICIHILSAQAIGDYQSAATGNWNVVTTWQTWNGSAWIAASATPNNTNGAITIQTGHTVTINAALTVDEVTVNGTMNTSAGIVLTIFNGAGVDLRINGTFGDQSTASISWNAGATWQMGAAGTLVKTTASSSNLWQSNYQGGIATIPSTSTWIIRKVNAQQPAVSTTGAVYPNLTIENNNAAAWTVPAGSSFTATTSSPTVKGNLNVGGSGTNTVDFLMNCTSVAPVVTVLGDVFIKVGCTLRNNGNGFDMAGDLTVNGTISYDANDARKIIFSGSNNQTISGPGLLNIYDLSLAKSTGTVTLNRPVTVDNLCTFTGGVMITTSTNLLTIPSAGTVAGANNASFVSGPVRYYGNNAFTFPIGKNADYQPLSIGSYIPTGGAVLNETFSNGCANNCTAPYTGPNGTWTVTSTGTNQPAGNIWYVSGAECGNAAGSCGSGCGAADPSLHIGPNDGFLTDGGARYDAGGGCPSFYCVTTSLRCESPTINLTGRFGVTVNFNYIERGELLDDNATLWYYDGTIWALLSDPPKTPTTCNPQGKWTAYSISLPPSADNNPNVKIGFQWVNDDDGAGSDPSFAVDDITVGTPAESFTAEYFYANPQVVYNNNLAPALSYIDACEYWVLDRLPLASTAATRVTLAWDANSCPAIPQVSDTRVAHFDLAIWQDEGNGGNTGTTAAGTVVSAAPVTYFSPFTIAFIPLTPLPIEMLRFDGICSGGLVSLKWTTASETGNDFFTVERSMDGISFSQIGNINGAGNSSQILSYHFNDTDPFAGINYYRIKQTDHNGQYSYSKIIAVDAKDCESQNLQLVHAFFNADDLEIDYAHENGPVTIEVYNSAGELIAHNTNTATASDFHFNAANWGKGLYFIRISDGVSSEARTILR
ncbi:hypothetical protein BH11BAC7_BH11BAC7_31120 [soil metagenome]